VEGRGGEGRRMGNILGDKGSQGIQLTIQVHLISISNVKVKFSIKQAMKF
jgi:hypothetical protein